MIMQQGMPENVRGAISVDESNAKNYLAELEKVYVKNDKAEVGTLLAKLTSMRYAGNGSVREHILSMSQIAKRLKVLDLVLSDDLLVHLALNSLPSQYGQIRTSYNC